MFSGRPIWMMDYSLVGIRIEDLILAPFYLLVIFLFARGIKKRNAGTPVEKFIYPALGIKLFSATMFGLMYQIIWGGKVTMGGDTSMYFQGGLAIWKSLFANPYYTLQLLYIPDLHLRYDDWADTLSWFMRFFQAGRILNSYLCTGLPFILYFWALGLTLMPVSYLLFSLFLVPGKYIKSFVKDIRG